MKKKILFRADGNSEIGLGHMYRIFAICEILKDSFEIRILTRSNSNVEIIPSEYHVTLIPKDIEMQFEPEWINDQFSIEEYKIVADGYRFDETYQSKLKQYGFYFVYIDDFAQNHMVADVVVNHSAYVTENMYSKEPYTTLALGTAFAMLRPMFLEAAKEKRKVTSIKDIFVCFGGADFNNLSLKITQALINVDQTLQVHIVLGNAYQFDEIKTLSKTYPNIKLYMGLSEFDMFALMNKCQLAIAPSSTISYELCCIGIPMISGYYIDNQFNLYQGLLKENIFYDGGDLKKQTTFNLEKLIRHVLGCPISDLQAKVDQQFALFNKNQKEIFRAIIN